MKTGYLYPCPASSALGMFADNTFVLDEFMLDYQALITYITDYLGGTVGTEYETAQGRIVVRKNYD